ncbi:GNAT family N-acetyltransferase [Vibrio quintilis]|uniref:Putative acetyltransferase n=1 Tax=Vibrio quintilis TaxID=1117707 RepID=A0A1M7YT15_9VIBR|nr:GNAT family N-acetyltransferase [Vibrio quintilis]SHO55762.1 putative acetyltransferase [Vibrio quintilis]
MMNQKKTIILACLNSGIRMDGSQARIGLMVGILFKPRTDSDPENKEIAVKAEMKPIDPDRDFACCVAARRDAYLCSFGSDEGFETFLCGYQARMRERLTQPEWYYYHVRVNGEIAGQLEFRNFSPQPETGYVNLIYLTPAFRGTGLAGQLQQFIFETLSQAGCKQVMLSVSRINQRALSFYEKSGWTYLRPNPKHPLTDFFLYVLEN